jgi:hypothetical protein
MSDLNYEVLVRVPVGAPGIRPEVWYIESAFPAFKPAQERYARFVTAHPDPRLVVALVRSTYDERAKLFHDTVVKSSNERVAPLRQNAKPLHPEARTVLQRDFSKPGAPPEALRIRARPPAPKRRINWVASGVLVVGVVAAAAAVAFR